MTARAKRRSDADDDRTVSEKERRQRELDEALDDTFPASDPPAVRPNRADPDPAPDTDSATGEGGSA